MATQGATQMPGRSTKGKGGIELYSPSYFAACTFGGIIACGPTHTCKYLLTVYPNNLLMSSSRNTLGSRELLPLQARPKSPAYFLKQ